MARNDYLRAARERTASPQHPHEGLSRQELAELVNEYIWEHHRKRVELDANYIGKLERGVIRWPCRLYREAFRAILNAPSDAALGFVNPRRSIVRRPANGTGDVDSSAKVADAEPLSGMAVLLNRGDPTTVRLGSPRTTSNRSPPLLGSYPPGITPMVVGLPERP